MSDFLKKHNKLKKILKFVTAKIKLIFTKTVLKIPVSLLIILFLL